MIETLSFPQTDHPPNYFPSNFTHLQLNAIRDYNKNERPLGQPPQAEEAPSEADDDAPLGSPPASGASSEFGNTESDDYDPDDDDGDAVIA